MHLIAQGVSDKLIKLLKDGLKVLIVRHPLIRIYSAWNDKFSFNSTESSGFAYGFKKLASKELRPLVYKFLPGKNF